jgi:hypothetical protein
LPKPNRPSVRMMIAPSRTRPVASTRQRGVTASAELVSLGFKLEPRLRTSKRAAIDKGVKFNEFLIYLIHEFAKLGTNFVRFP